MDFPGSFGIERHAQQCYSCGKEMRDAIRLGQMARALNRVKAPANFEARLLARLQDAKARRTSSQLWKLWDYVADQVSLRAVAAGAAATVLLGLGIFILVHPRQFRPPLFVERGDRPAAPVAAVDSNAARAPVPVNAGAAADGVAAQILNPRIVPIGDPKSRSSLADDWTESFLDPGDLGFLEYRVPGPGDRQLIMRLPKSIRVRYGQPSEEYFIRHVSH